MPRNFVIGIGGTGARCVESLLHLCGAGLGPPDLWVGFVDQDIGHANVVQAGEALDKLDRLQVTFGDGASADYAGENLPLFQTRFWSGDQFARLVADKVWCPVPTHNDREKTFEGVFNWHDTSEEGQALMQALYRRGPPDWKAADSEHRLPLDVGFRGRPSLAAAIILSEREKDPTGFWAKLEKQIKDYAEQSKQSAQVLFVGSVFGGTGAGALPILARRLRSRVKPAQANIGAILVGPYFSYKTVDPRFGISADAGQFPSRLRGSFQYYANMLSREHVLERAYLVGWPNMIDFGGKSDVDRTGQKNQRNPATLPELYAGLAAVHFFNDKVVHETTAIFAAAFDGAVETVRRGSSETARFLVWSDLPYASREMLDHRLYTYIRFCTLLKLVYVAEARAERGWFSPNEAWFRRFIKPVRDASRLATLKELGEYAALALAWWGGIALLGETSGTSTELPRSLIDATMFAAKTTNGETGTTEITVYDQVLPGLVDEFSRMARNHEGASLATVYQTMNAASIAVGARGIGNFVRALYQVAAN